MGFDTMMAQQPFWIADAAVVRFVNSLLIDDMGLMEFSVSFTCLVVPLDFNDTNLTCKTTKVELRTNATMESCRPFVKMRVKILHAFPDI